MVIKTHSLENSEGSWIIYEEPKPAQKNKRYWLVGKMFLSVKHEPVFMTYGRCSSISRAVKILKEEISKENKIFEEHFASLYKHSNPKIEIINDGAS